MPEPKEKTKRPHIKERTPRKRTEEVFPFLRKPAADSIAEIIGISEPTPPTPRTPPTDATHPISPDRDFTKVPNSLSRDVVPAGHFVGKSKQLYDCLFQRTRGAISPARRLAISKPDLMKASAIGSERTLLKNLGHLKDLGLVRVTYTDGRHEGNTYEVFTPEEVGLRTPRTPPTPRHARVEVPPVPPVESGVRDVGSKSLESIVSEPPKTLIQDKERTDDEAAPLARALTQTERELTGKVTADAAKWEDLASVLITELKIAAGRTVVSSVPAFLAEHLRRRLWKKDKRQVEEEGKSEVQGSQLKVDGSKCPDCFGTGMWYPEGFEKGVAKCRHEKLGTAD
jgi:hypothetical protein